MSIDWSRIVCAVCDSPHSRMSMKRSQAAATRARSGEPSSRPCENSVTSKPAVSRCSSTSTSSMLVAWCWKSDDR